MKKLFEPFHKLSSTLTTWLVLIQFLILALVLEIFHSEIIPSPFHIIDGVWKLLCNPVFYDNLFISFVFIMKAMFSAMIIALPLSYLSQIGFFKKIIDIICSFRYLTITGLSTIITFLSPDVETIKHNLLLFAIIPFFVTSMLDIMNNTLKQDIELGYTLKKSRWWILKEVVIIGTLDKTFVTMSTNFAICWLMITTVEGKAFNMGGIGTMLITSDKYVKLDETIPLLILVLFIGIGCDFLFRYLRAQLFKYTTI